MVKPAKEMSLQLHNKSSKIIMTLVLEFPVKFGELGIVCFGETAVCTNQGVTVNKKIAKFGKDQKKRDEPFGSNIDDEEDFSLVNAQIQVLAGAILIPRKQEQGINK